MGDAFRERLRKFPALVNCTTIDWCGLRSWAMVAGLLYVVEFIVYFDWAPTLGLQLLQLELN